MPTLTTSGASLYAFLLVLFNRILNMAMHEIQLLARVNSELKQLRITLLRIRSVLVEAEARQVMDESLSIWLMALRDVAYDADDVLDEYEAEVLRLKGVCRCCALFCFQHNVTYLSLAHRIARIQKTLSKIIEEREIKLGELEGSKKLEITEIGETSSFVTEPYVIGREEDKKNVIRLLQEYIDDGGSSNRVIPVVPIVGLGGVGKTTLARLIYHDDSLEGCFDLKMWVSVSDDFNVKRLIREMIEYASGGKPSDLTNLNLLLVALKKELKDKRFLLVLDNVWNTDLSKWKIIQASLVAGEVGSKIIVTTQDRKVADMMGTVQPYFLDGLSEDDYWLLFKHYLFTNGISDEHQKLEAIGREIAQKMNGLPIGALELGCYLKSNMMEHKWWEILDTEIWEMPLGNFNILLPLKSSFEHLPHHLKRCFAFCSLFPKGYAFQKDKMIQIWMAHNLIQPQKARRMEDTGKEYFTDLVSRSFFQHRGSDFVMHNSVYDLAQSIFSDEFVRVDDDSSLEIPDTIRHLSWSPESLRVQKLRQHKKLRTFLLMGENQRLSRHNLYMAFSRLRCLRVLDLSNCLISVLPPSICNSKHLRYLDLSNTGIRRLPKSVTCLYHLQTLNLKNCRLHKLPQGMSNLVSMRHLIANEKVVSQIVRLGKLTSLQELKMFNVQKRRGYRILELGSLDELQGDLTVRNLQNVCNKAESRRAYMDGKQFLRKLSLEWADGADFRDPGVDEEVLEGLQPNLNLVELHIVFYDGFSSPSWMTSQFLPNIEAVHLYNCRRWEELPPLGAMQFLRYLEISGMHGVRQFGPQFYGCGQVMGFPSLEELRISHMPELQCWSEPEGSLPFFPRLHELFIEDCPELSSLPSLPPTIEKLTICRVGLTTLPGLQRSNGMSQNTSLTCLSISVCANLRSLREGLLQHHLAAKALVTISDCNALDSLPEELFRDDLFLKVTGCPKLTFLSDDESLPSLENHSAT